MSALARLPPVVGLNRRQVPSSKTAAVSRFFATAASSAPLAYSDRTTADGLETRALRAGQMPSARAASTAVPFLLPDSPDVSELGCEGIARDGAPLQTRRKRNSSHSRLGLCASPSIADMLGADGLENQPPAHAAPAPCAAAVSDLIPLLDGSPTLSELQTLQLSSKAAAANLQTAGGKQHTECGATFEPCHLRADVDVADSSPTMSEVLHTPNGGAAVRGTAAAARRGSKRRQQDDDGFTAQAAPPADLQHHQQQHFDRAFAGYGKGADEDQQPFSACEPGDSVVEFEEGKATPVATTSQQFSPDRLEHDENSDSNAFHGIGHVRKYARIAEKAVRKAAGSSTVKRKGAAGGKAASINMFVTSALAAGEAAARKPFKAPQRREGPAQKSIQQGFAKFAFSQKR